MMRIKLFLVLLAGVMLAPLALASDCTHPLILRAGGTVTLTAPDEVAALIVGDAAEYRLTIDGAVGGVKVYHDPCIPEFRGALVYENPANTEALETPPLSGEYAFKSADRGLLWLFFYEAAPNTRVTVEIVKLLPAAKAVKPAAAAKRKP